MLGKEVRWGRHRESWGLPEVMEGEDLKQISYEESGRRVLQAEGTACAKVLRQESAARVSEEQQRSQHSWSKMREVVFVF